MANRNASHLRRHPGDELKLAIEAIATGLFGLQRGAGRKP
jgi:hypothetical protein